MLIGGGTDAGRRIVSHSELDCHSILYITMHTVPRHTVTLVCVCVFTVCRAFELLRL